MIAPELVEQIKRLLAEGHLSQRAIARLTGVSRGSVNAIAQGKRHEPRPRRHEELLPQAPSGPPQRCPTCGGLVYMPCVLCYVRSSLAQNPSPRRPEGPAEPMQIALTDEHRTRYLPFYTRRAQRLASKPLASLSPTGGTLG